MTPFLFEEPCVKLVFFETHFKKCQLMLNFPPKLNFMFINSFNLRHNPVSLTLWDWSFIDEETEISSTLLI